jgi:hypothetical protein
MKKANVVKKDIEKGFKRVNLSLPIEDMENLLLVAEYNGDVRPTALASSWVKKRAATEAYIILKGGYVPKAQSGFSIFGEMKNAKKRTVEKQLNKKR